MPAETELQAIEETIQPITKKRELVAELVYGSQVAGYAKKDSDYDVILVLKSFPQRIKYYYLKGDAEVSALVVDERSFENDCRKSSLGEFVSGRLLNVYYPAFGEEFLSENEAEFKKRVVLEGLFEAYAEYANFALEIDYPLKYFLFEKLRKRASIYPPVIYSYAKTYGEELAKKNVESSLNGFRKAALHLENEKIVSYDRDRDVLKLLGQKQYESPFRRGGIPARLEVAASYTQKSLTQYAVHGYAGRVRPKVVGKEVLSKISRSRNSGGKLPSSIQEPKSEWKIPEGKLYYETKNWVSDLLDLFGMEEETSKVSQNSLGEFYNSAGFYTLEDADSGKKVSIAVKRFRDVKGMKWGVLSLWSLKNANFSASAMERLFREYRAIMELRKLGISTPEVLAVFLSERMSVTRFVSGRDLSKIESDFLSGSSEELEPIVSFGRDLATLHNDGYCMGDTKPSNAVYSDSLKKLFFVDLEQCTNCGGNKTWDLAEFIYYSVRFTMKEERARKLVSAFVQGYESQASDLAVVEEAGALRYRAPFQAFIAPNVMSALRRDLKR